MSNNQTKTAINLESFYNTDPKKACQLALRQTNNVPTKERIEAINKGHSYTVEQMEYRYGSQTINTKSFQSIN